MPLIVKLLKRQISKQLSYGYDVGRGYVAGEEEVRKLIDHMIDQKDIAKNLKQSSDNGRLDVIRCLGKCLKQFDDSPGNCVTKPRELLFGCNLVSEKYSAVFKSSLT